MQPRKRPQRADSTRPLIRNDWLAFLPSHAVVCDLVVDPYVLSIDPPTVRSIEGIPRGDLNQYIFLPDDPGWSRAIPESIPTKHRRTTVSCYSWPGIHAEACMKRYSSQLWPFLERVLELGGVEKLQRDGDYIERALWRASLRSWDDNAQRIDRLKP